MNHLKVIAMFADGRWAEITTSGSDAVVVRPDGTVKIEGEGAITTSSEGVVGPSSWEE